MKFLYYINNKQDHNKTFKSYAKKFKRSTGKM